LAGCASINILVVLIVASANVAMDLEGAAVTLPTSKRSAQHIFIKQTFEPFIGITLFYSLGMQRVTHSLLASCSKFSGCSTAEIRTHIPARV
jgi:hypothetical protein